MPDRIKYRTSSGVGWRAELVATFVCGFLLATILWLGLWLFQRRPAQAAAFQEKEAAVQAKEAALQNCLAAEQQCEGLKDSLQAENNETNAKLKEALIAWGRCIKGKTLSAPREKPNPNSPQ